MIGSNRFSAAFGNITSTPDPDGFRRFMRSAARDHRFALVFCEAGTKLPVCTLSSVARKKADEEVQQSARAAGDRKWATRSHACGIAHATTDSAEIDKYLQRRFKNGGSIPNVAIEVGASRMLAIDVDTADELAAWAASWEAATGKPWPDEGLTVRSPGVRDNGVWKHSGGGHVWIDLSTLPESAERELLLGIGAGVFKHPSGWTAMYRDRYVLVPPSIRPEGKYEYNSSPVSDNVDWVVAAVATDAANRESARMETAERRATRLADPGTKPSDRALIEWSQATPWHELLAAQGWVDTGLAHACGCPDWTMAPVEDHASPRSATAHEDGCSSHHYSDDEGHTALHLWTDTRPPFLQGLGSTMTKLQFAAAVARPESRHGMPLSGEDITAGMRSAGMASSGAELRPLGPADMVVAPNPATAPVSTATMVEEREDPAPAEAENRVVSPETTAPAPAPTLGTFGVLPPPPVATAEIVPQAQGQEHHFATGYQTEKHFLSLRALRELPEPEPLIVDLLDQGSLCRVYGQSGHGKTFVMVDIAASLVTGRPWAGHQVAGKGRVVYLAAEDALGVGKRFATWIDRHSLSDEEADDFDARLRIINYSVQANSPDWAVAVADMAGFAPALVVVDTQAQTSAGLEENSNTEMMEYVKRLQQIIVSTGAAVVVVHHTGKDGRAPRGASAVYGALDLEYSVTASGGAREQTIEVANTKAKNRAKWEQPVQGALVSHGMSAVMSYDPTQIPDHNAARAREEVASGAHAGKESAVLAILVDSAPVGLSISQWSKECEEQARIPDSTARRFIKNLITSGRVTDRHGHVVGSPELEKLPRGTQLFAAPESLDTEAAPGTRPE